MSELHAQTVPFVRDSMLPQELPPASQRGAVKWVRENLFSGPMNTILTVLSLLVVFLILQSSLPWWLNSVWNANSLAECRAAVQAMAGEGATGACWAVIRERWHQFMFGFYPRGLYWRPVLAFALLFVALAPVLFGDNARKRMILLACVAVALVLALIGVGTDLAHVSFAIVAMAAILAVSHLAPARLIWATLLFPAVGFFLLWGGSVWGPIGVLMGFGVLVAVYRLLLPMLGVVMGTALGFLAACVWWLMIQTHVTTVLHNLMPWGLEAIDSDQFGGFLLAFTIGVTAIAASLPLGILLALGRRSDMFLIKTLSVGFIEFIRGVPLITMLFTASLLLQYFLPPQTNFDLILRVIILVTLFASAYIAEVVRGGLAALPRGQYEAADALGLDYWKAQRHIIMPQALKISIPGIVSSFIGLFKDTTLVAFVGLLDPLKGVTAIVRADINWKGIYWEPYIFVGTIFFLICFGMSRYSMYLEKKLKTDHR
ncbi:amino acid ABC transporter permease [Fertoebacter nigrum]|uniref:Amino acid ABC transporter permease n=1 Tax=Fertoeibacter niger TaxID=2656921 RepID=A0A8X8KQV5_9RHOB|nr:amino acid ABC transporter permease [Fertoeibacter niger]NUB44497.1 amino acid ABC transporter permease [Fertoeibacter niger]